MQRQEVESGRLQADMALLQSKLGAVNAKGFKF